MSRRPWRPGLAGKGLLVGKGADLRLVLWATTDDGAPHHHDVVTGIDDPVVACLSVDVDGFVSVLDVGDTEAIGALAARLDERLHPRGRRETSGAWNFG